jgi:hypothetical protein
MHGSVRQRTEAPADWEDDGSSGKQTAARVCTLTQVEGHIMLYTIAIILLVLWLLGMVTSVAAGGLIHILLVVAIVIIAIRLFTGRKVL